MQAGFFRKEVLSPAAKGVYGPICLTQSLQSWVLVTTAILVVSCFLTYLTIGSYTKRATAIGFLTPVDGVVRIFPPIAGVISERLVDEGKTVSKGEVLFVISDERNQFGQGKQLKVGEAHTLSLRLRMENLLKARELSITSSEQNERTIKNKIRMINEELTHRNTQVALQIKRVESAFRTLQRYRELSDVRAVSEVEIQERNDLYEAQQAELLSMQRQKVELQRALVSAEDELRQIPISMNRSLTDIDREVGLLAQETVETEARGRYAITAPMDGVISSVTAQLGQSTNGQAIASLLPADSPLKANLYLPSRAIGFVKIGQKVRIRYQAYPYQKFGQYSGIVDEISRNPIQVGDIPLTLPLTTQEGVYGVSVKLASQHIVAYGKDVVLRPGMIMEADIEQDRRRLIEWIIEPLFGFEKYL
ncbi:HlyD family secretion protein [Acidovorax sp. GBBC 3334]|uniref:HlyD family secretion protein n=1 Tax=Acidovorax sp. GBBC 3334 TaxID=2940496 RepID=UPI0023038E9E|nr:HlyD family secretion protein [Acidovorax sp. GBBC 3334]MDA8455138.1 HlyD family secretion protein [Acidovorax sp. GBBC 3334]